MRKTETTPRVEMRETRGPGTEFAPVTEHHHTDATEGSHADAGYPRAAAPAPEVPRRLIEQPTDTAMGRLIAAHDQADNHETRTRAAHRVVHLDAFQRNGTGYLTAFPTLGIPVYGGTVDAEVVASRRRKNKAARVARRVNRRRG